MAAASDPIVIGDAKKSDSKRLLLMVGAGVALLLAVLVLPKLLGGGGSENLADEFGPNPTATTTQPTTSTTVPSTGVAAGGSKNPFAPLFVVAGDTAASSPAGMDASNTTTVYPTVAGSTDPGTTTTDPAGSTSTPPSGTSGSGTSGTTSSGLRLRLLEVQDDGQAIVQVDDDVYQVVVNDTFADYFRVSSTDALTRCGTFVYGDRRVALCEGDEAVL